MKKFIIVVAGLAVVTLALMLWLAAAGGTSPSAPVADTAQRDEIIAYLSSEDFANLPESEQAAYASKLWDLPFERRMELLRVEGTDKDARSLARKNLFRAMRARMLLQAREFFEMSPDEQIAHLNKQAEEMENRRREWDKHSTDAEKKSDPPWRRAGKISPDKVQKFMQRWISGSTAEERAVLSEYFKRLREHSN